MFRKGVIDLLEDLNGVLEVAENLLIDLEKYEYSEKWDRKYINDLPSSAFAVVEKGYTEGKDKGARHLPHHNRAVKTASENSSVDLSHYRNALARVNQIKSVLGNESDSTLRQKAAKHLEKHRSVLSVEKSCFNIIETTLWEECEDLFEKNIKPLLSDNEPMEEK